MDGYDFLALDPEYNGACPCARFTFEGTHFDVHCWRVCSVCTYSGIHFDGDRDAALRVQEALNALDWTEFELVEGSR